MRREGEEGGLGTVLVFNSLLYKSTPIKEMENNYLLITLPASDGKLSSYLIKPASDHCEVSLKEKIESIIQSIYDCLFQQTVLFYN